jgi:hypothetical protein
VRSGQVSDVIPGVGTAPDTVNVASGGGDGIPGVLCTVPVLPGDTVWIDQFAGNWYVVVNASRKIAPAVVPIVQFGNPVDVPAGARDIAAVKAGVGPAGQPLLFGVYTTPPPVPTAASVFQPTFSRTWDPTNNWDTRNDQVRQGNYPGIGAATGCWFYPDIPAGLAGTTPAVAVVHVVRDSSGGVYGPVPVRLALHAATGPSGSPPPVVTPVMGSVSLSVNATADIRLPDDWVPLLVSGAAKGVCVTSSARSDYQILRGVSGQSGALSFT